MNILINYAHGRFYESQKNNAKTGLEVGGFDEVRTYNFDDIDKSFMRKNWHILGHKTGAGYWMWKSYFILKTLNECSEGDVVCYSDSGASFIDSAKPLIDICQENDILPFYLIDPDKPSFESSNDPRGKILWEREQTKRDVFYYMNCDDMDDVRVQQVHEARPRCGSPQFYRKCDFTMQFVNEYMRYCEDYRLITDAPNTCGFDDYPENKVYRRDQSIFSVFTKMLGIKAYQDPAYPSFSQLPDTGKFYSNEMPSEILYHQIIDPHRKSQ